MSLCLTLLGDPLSPGDNIPLSGRPEEKSGSEVDVLEFFPTSFGGGGAPALEEEMMSPNLIHATAQAIDIDMPSPLPDVIWQPMRSRDPVNLSSPGVWFGRQVLRLCCSWRGCS